MVLINKETNETISEKLQIADTFFKRLKGLMFTKELPEQNALQIIPCNEIHTFFMKYNIDVLYLDKKNKVISIDENLKPGRIGKLVRNAKSVIELPKGKIKKSFLEIGQEVDILR